MNARESMVHEMCAAVDAGDAALFASWFTEDATYRFGNGEVLVGRDAVEAATAGAADSLPWVRHTVEQVAEVGDQLFCVFTIRTAGPDHREIAMPCVTVIRVETLNGMNLIVDYRVHMDLSPAFAAHGQVP